MSCETRFQHELQQRGLRMTPQREMVLAALHVLDAPATADSIYHEVQTKSAAVDKATVYRTLELLQELELVRPVDLGDGVGRFELSQHEAHAHLLCIRCGQLSAIDIDALGDLAQRLVSVCGFQPDLEHLIIRGLCCACADAAPRN
jgi:Fur family ferric uptake transcriptional regulator